MPVDPIKTLRVLNVEDSQPDAMLLHYHLSECGYEVVMERVDSEAEMRTALNKEWDIIVADYMMPGFSALKALYLLKATGKDIPVIVISGAIGEELAVEFMRAGAADYFVKGKLMRLTAAIEREMEYVRIRRSSDQAEKRRTFLGAEVERQRDRLNTMISSVPGIVWEEWSRRDSTHRIDFVNEQVENMTGYSAQEWISTPNFWLSIVHPEDKARTAKIAAASFTNKTESTQEFRWIAKDGRILWVESRSVVIVDENGTPAGIRGFIVDIGKRRRAEQALRDSED